MTVEKCAVIPGSREAADPETRCTHRIWFWIPGSRATHAPRDDEVSDCNEGNKT
jgi:hypothetical protein